MKITSIFEAQKRAYIAIGGICFALILDYLMPATRPFLIFAADKLGTTFQGAEIRYTIDK